MNLCTYLTSIFPLALSKERTYETDSDFNASQFPLSLQYSPFAAPILNRAITR